MAEPVGRALPRRGEAGGRIPSFPQTAGARAPAPQCGSVRKRAKPRHLGASSPSGNVRGGCRGWTPWAGQPLATRNARRHHWHLHLSRLPCLSKARPDLARFRPYNFKRIPPRKNKKHESGNGRGRTRRPEEARGGVEIPCERSVRCGTKPPRTRSVRQSASGGKSVRSGEMGSSGVQ